MEKKIEIWDVGCIEKWYDISDKIIFWDDKIEWDEISSCECSYELSQIM